MLCPNKNTKEWKDLVAKVGEARALLMWQHEGDSIQTSSTDSTVKDAIAEKVIGNEEYFREKYNSYLTPLIGGRADAESIVEAFYSRFAGKNPVLEGDNVVTTNGKALLFPESTKEYKEVAEITPDLEKLLIKLSSNFSIPYKVINEPETPWKGRYINDGLTKQVIINVAHATADTPLHEYYHPVVRMLNLQNQPLFQSILKDARSNGDVRADEEEVVTSYLAKQAIAKQPSTFFELFIQFLKNLFYKTSITKATTIGELLRILQNKVDLSGETTLTEAYDKMNSLLTDIANTYRIDRSKNKTDYIAQLVAASAEYSTSDTSTFYQDRSGADVARRLTSLIGDREVGEFSTQYKGQKETRAEWHARNRWKSETGVDVTGQAPNTISGEIKIDGTSYTFAQLVEALDKQFARQRVLGKLVHSYLQYVFEEDPKLKEQARLQTLEYAKQRGTPFTQLEYQEDLAKITANLDEIAMKANIAVNVGGVQRYNDKNKDKFAPEVILKSDILTDAAGNLIATTADGILQHFNGDLSMIDWKTGNITKDMNTPRLLKFGAKFGVTDSPLGRAYLELAFRALMIKEKFPDAKFRDIKIVKVNSDGSVKNMHLNLADYLATIGEYYKETNPKVYAKLMEQNLLDSKEYEGASEAVIDVFSQIAGLPYRSQLDYLRAKLSSLHYGKTKDQINADYAVRELSIQYTKAILELEKLEGTNLDTPTADIPWGLGKLKNLSDISNPKVQTFHKILLEAKNAISRDKKKFEDTQDALYAAVVKENGGKVSRTVDALSFIGVASSVVMVNPWVFAGVLLARKAFYKNFKPTTKDHFNFMWRLSADPRKPGSYMNLRDTYLKDGVEIPMSQAQKNYRNYVRNSMASKYREFSQQIVRYSKIGTAITRAQAMNLPDELPEDFMPRLPKPLIEVREEEGFWSNAAGIKTNAAHHARQYLTSFIEDEFEDNNTPIPLSYLKHTGSTVVDEGLHSFDVELAVKSFMGNIEYKHKMDPLYDLAVGLSNALKEEVDEKNQMRYPELVKFVEEVTYPQILGSSKKTQLQSRKWRFEAGAATDFITNGTIKKGTPMVLSQEAFMRAIKSSVTFAVMSFKVLSPLRNAFMITMQTVTQPTQRIVNAVLSKILGVVPDSFDTMHTSSIGTVLNDYYKNKILGQEEKSKLWNLAVKFNWFPDDYPYAVNKDRLLSHPISLAPETQAFMFYKFGEDLGAIWQLAGLLKGTKVKDLNGKEVSLWDAHDSQGNWKIGVRGKVVRAGGVEEDLTELEALEIKTLKRAYEKLNGSYRHEEKTAIEATVIGDFVMQFKKYFYQYMKTLFGGERKDITVGKYVKTGERPDGMPIYQWHSEIFEGQMVVLATSILTLARGPKAVAEYLKGKRVTDSNVTHNHRVRALANAMNTGIWLAVLLTAFMTKLDDDDEKDFLGRQLQRTILDMSRGMHPKDMFDTAKTPIVAAQRVSDVGNALWAFMFGGLWGKTTADGSLQGSKTLLRSTPFVSSAMQYRDLFKGYDPGSDPLLDMVTRNY